MLRKSTSALPLAATGAFHGPVKVLLVDADNGYLEEMGDLLHEDGYEAVLARCADDG